MAETKKPWKRDSLTMQLADTMVKRGLVTKEQLNKALERVTDGNVTLNDALIDLGYVTDWELVAFISLEAELPFVEIEPRKMTPGIEKRVPPLLAIKHKMFPLGLKDGAITLAFSNPLTVFQLDDIKNVLGREITPVLAKSHEVDGLIRAYYGRALRFANATNEAVAAKMEIPEEELAVTVDLEKMVTQPPLVKLVNELIINAVQDGASDIHIEPRRNSVEIRTRIDGVLDEVSTIPQDLRLAVASRVKIMADMDISERRVPQDGHIETNVSGKSIDIRVSSFPVLYGEKIVMRILDKSAAVKDLGVLGLSETDYERVNALLARPYGMVLVVGPTGSGKSTTLYAMLKALCTPDKNIMSLEDPVEYEVSMVNQGQINPRAGLTFANGLRSLLRQDPDIIMLGEIRDLETAELATRSALTGHLLLSTLHTMNAPFSPVRLMDMGVEPFLISSSLSGVIAQRLVRKICQRCKTEYEPKPALLKTLGLKPKAAPKLWRGKGCRSCRNMGYKGRIGLFEVMTVNEEIRDLIVKRATGDEVKRASIRNGMVTLREDGIDKMLGGITTAEEVIRVTAEDAPL